MQLSIFSPRGVGGGGGTLGIRQQNNPNPQGLDRPSKDMGWVIRYFSRGSELNYITSLMAHPRDVGHKIFANGFGISQRFYSYVNSELNNRKNCFKIITVFIFVNKKKRQHKNIAFTGSLRIKCMNLNAFWCLKKLGTSRIT